MSFTEENAIDTLRTVHGLLVTTSGSLSAVPSANHYQGQLQLHSQ